MKHWRETAEILERLVDLSSRGRRAAIATVVRISGSSYRRPGAKLLIEDEGCTIGGVSGGCLEGDVREIARHVIDTGVSQLLHYDTGSDDHTVWGLGLGCNGSVDIFIQPASDPSTLDIARAVRDRLAAPDTFAVSTIVDGVADVGRSIVFHAGHVDATSTNDADLDRALAQLAASAIEEGRSRVDRLDTRLVFTDVMIAPPVLIVCGAGDDARPLVAYASDAGFAVTLVDHRGAYLTAERFPAAQRLLTLRPYDDMDIRNAFENVDTLAPLKIDAHTLVVIKTHSFGHDRDWVRAFLRTSAPYIGLLGPHGRSVEILEQIGSGAGDRVFGPVGLDIGADGPEQIAISIVAELLAVRARHRPGHLRERGAAIHV